jgi:hypothetical protein
MREMDLWCWVLERCKSFANRNSRDFGWEVAHEAVSRRPPIPLCTIVARTRLYTCDAKVWDLSIVQGTIFCHAVPNPNDSQLVLLAMLGFGVRRATFLRGTAWHERKAAEALVAESAVPERR